jgi:hypothetical protein
MLLSAGSLVSAPRSPQKEKQKIKKSSAIGGFRNFYF